MATNEFPYPYRVTQLPECHWDPIGRQNLCYDCHTTADLMFLRQPEVEVEAVVCVIIDPPDRGVSWSVHLCANHYRQTFGTE